jgi:hypothetical protein
MIADCGLLIADCRDVVKPQVALEASRRPFQSAFRNPQSPLPSIAFRAPIIFLLENVKNFTKSGG